MDGADVVAKYGLIRLLILMIALQSSVGVAVVNQLHSPATPHFLEHSEGAWQSEMQQQSDGLASETSHNASDHCHHSHGQFHMVLVGSLPQVFSPVVVSLLPEYRASLVPGFHSALFRPPIA